MSGPKEHKHPKNPRNKIFGIRLKEGDLVTEKDVYPASNGEWFETNLRFNLGKPNIPQAMFWIRLVPKPEI